MVCLFVRHPISSEISRLRSVSGQTRWRPINNRIHEEDRRHVMTVIRRSINEFGKEAHRRSAIDIDQGATITTVVALCRTPADQDANAPAILSVSLQSRLHRSCQPHRRPTTSTTNHRWWLSKTAKLCRGAGKTTISSRFQISASPIFVDWIFVSIRRQFVLDWGLFSILLILFL
nr:hypothetical protein Iba_chr01aCG4570 [Ipomoea batatas]